MSDYIPDAICYSILLLVPAEPLIRFRSVCKTWRRIIDDPTFIKKHVNLHHQEEFSRNQILIRTNDDGNYYSLSLSSLDSNSGSVTLTSIPNFFGFGVPKIKRLSLPSHSGMILVTKNSPEDESKKWMLWNPFTRDTFVLPSHAHLITGIDINPSVPRKGFGYDSVADDFKVVRILQLIGPDDTYMLEILIYSLNLNTWKRRILNYDHCMQPPDCETNGVFLNGALHWIVPVNILGIYERIFAFNLSTEEGHMLPYPSFLTKRIRLLDHHLDVLGGFLSLRSKKSGLFILEDYGGDKWTKLVSPIHLPHLGNPIHFIKSRGQILSQHFNDFVLFDVKKKRGQKFSMEGLPKNITSQVFPSSLFRLNTSAGVGNDGSFALKKALKRKRSTANNRYKLDLETSIVKGRPSKSLEYFGPFPGGGKWNDFA